MPYITHIHIENCRNVKTLDVDLSPEGPKDEDEAEPASTNQPTLPFRHLILTGPNGSGKSGVLRSVAVECAKVPARSSVVESDFDVLTRNVDRLGKSTIKWSGRDQGKSPNRAFYEGDLFFAYLPASRNFIQQRIPGPSSIELDHDRVGPAKLLGNLLLQFLVNKETERVHAFADGDIATSDRIKVWFDGLEAKVRLLMEDAKLRWWYDRKAFTFRLRTGDGYEFDLNTLADGHAAAFALIAETLLRIEAAQRIKKDYTFEPEGIVIVDEIETHLHLSLQEQILPLLTTMFPQVQFIVATHSPAVIASIPDAVVYDLRKMEQRSSLDYRGIPYGLLMTKHFGISSDIDLDSTTKLLRFRALAQQLSRTNDETREMEDLATVLSGRSGILATEVWMVKEHLAASSIQLAGE